MKKKLKSGLVKCEKYKVANCNWHNLSPDHWCDACKDGRIEREKKLAELNDKNNNEGEMNTKAVKLMGKQFYYNLSRGLFYSLLFGSPLALITYLMHRFQPSASIFGGDDIGSPPVILVAILFYILIGAFALTFYSWFYSWYKQACEEVKANEKPSKPRRRK